MAFDGKSLNKLNDWWHVNGNPAIDIWLDYDGELVFYNTDKAERVAHIMRPGDGDCFLILDYGLMDDPFTAQEHRQIAKFVRVNNAKFYD